MIATETYAPGTVWTYVGPEARLDGHRVAVTYVERQILSGEVWIDVRSTETGATALCTPDMLDAS